MVRPDWTLLAKQPRTLQGMDAAASGQAVVSAFRLDGATVVVSRVADMKWYLWMYFGQSNVPDNKKHLDFSRVPTQFVPSLKSAFYRWWMCGMPGKVRPDASTLVAALNRVIPFVRWLDKQGVRNFGGTTALHLSSYMQSQRDRGLAPRTLVCLLHEVQRLHRLKEHCDDGLMVNPWNGSSAALIAGFVSNGRETHVRQARTPVIREEVVSELFRHCECVVGSVTCVDRGVPDVAVRDALFFLLGITSGMRSEELLGIEIGCIRQDVVDGEKYTWLQSVEHKTKYGAGEWMVPGDAARWVAVLERWSAPLRARITELLLEAELLPMDEMSATDRAHHMKRLHRLRQDQKRLFLGLERRLGRPATLTNSAANDGLKRVAIAAGVRWSLEAHQMRRTMAVLCAHHQLGDLLYLKQHLKHRSLDMTALYAMNPAQDDALFNEIFDALHEAKAGLVAHWLDPNTLLAGGAASAIKARQIATIGSRKELAEDIADKVSIRATGHGWCLAQDDGCGGRGLYERTRCVSCADGLIDDRYKPVWQGIFAQQVELLADVPTLGSGAQRRIRIDVEKSARVLNDLGVAVHVPELAA